MRNQTFSVAGMEKVINSLWNILDALRAEKNISSYYPTLGYIACMKALGVSSLDELLHVLHDDVSCIKHVIKSGAQIMNPAIKISMMDNLRQLHIESNSHLGDAIDKFLSKFSEDAPLLEAFDSILQSSGKSEGIFMPSPELVKLGYKLLGNKPGKVLDPFAGVGGFATNNETYTEFRGTEIANHIKELGEIRMSLAGVSDNASYLSDVEAFMKERYTSMITMPPFRMKMLSPLDHTDTMSDLVPFHIYMDENDFIEEKMVCFVPMAFLSEQRSVTVDVRKKATDGHYIETIVELPTGLLFNTGLAIAAVLMSTDKKDYVRIIDAQNAFTKDGKTKVLDIDAISTMLEEGGEHCFKMAFDEIVANNYSWFMSKELKDEQNKAYPANYTIREFSDLATFDPGVIDQTVTMSHVVNFQSLSKDWTDCMQDVESFPVMDCTEKRYRKITQPVLMLSNRAELRPTFCNASLENPIMVDASIYCYAVSNEVYVGYLIKELTSCYLMTEGFGIPRISRSYLEHLKIGYPSLDIQQTLFEDAVRSNKLAQARELGLQSIIDSMKADYINEVRARKHDMKTPMTQLRNSLTLLKELVNELPEEYALRLDKYVSRQQKAMDVLSTIVSHIADETVFATPEIFDMESVLKSFKTVTDKYVIEYHRDETSLKVAEIETPYLNMGKVDFIRLVQNIVSNAVHRGFVGNNAEYALHITLSVEKGFYVIDFSNNGEPLPEGMDKERYGTKGAKGVNSDGSGTGGYIVKSITQHYGGDFDIFSTNFANIDFTNVIVKLPIYIKEDE